MRCLFSTKCLFVAMFHRFWIHHIVKCSGVLAVVVKQGSHDWWVFKHVTTLLALVMSSSVYIQQMRCCYNVELASYKLTSWYELHCFPGFE